MQGYPTLTEKEMDSLYQLLAHDEPEMMRQGWDMAWQLGVDALSMKDCYVDIIPTKPQHYHTAYAKIFWAYMVEYYPEYVNDHVIMLDLSEIALARIPDSIGEIIGLRELWVYDNFLTEIPDSIGELVKLKSIKAQRNQITELPDSIGDCVKLTELQLGYNQITELPDSICELKELKDLNLRNNPISKLPDCIANLKKLSYLDLRFTKISRAEEDKIRELLPKTRIEF